MLKELRKKTLPDIYTPKDAAALLEKFPDSEYMFGSEEVDPNIAEDMAKIYSMPEFMLDETKEMIEKASRVGFMPMHLANYRNKKVSMNDICMLDLVNAGFIGAGMSAGSTAGFLWRGAYFAGRRGWWRYQTIRGRHQMLMANYLAQGIRNDSDAVKQEFLNEADETLFESGFEAIFTRVHSLMESRGMQEKIPQAAQFLTRLQFSPTYGPRNIYTDQRDMLTSKIDKRWLKKATNIGLAAGLIGSASVLNSYGGPALESLVQSQIELPAGTVQNALSQALMMFNITVGLGAASRMEKGAFEQRRDESKRLSSNEFKFPYTYSPVDTVIRTGKFFKYLNDVWGKLPGYRSVESISDIDVVKRGIEERLEQDGVDHRRKEFTMNLISDAMRSIGESPRSSFPKDFYVRGETIPPIYFRLPELFNEKKLAVI